MVLQQTEVGYAIASLTLIYFLLMLNIARRYHLTLMDSLRVSHARERAEATVIQQAYYDPLTALPNRRLLCDRLQLGSSVGIALFPADGDSPEELLRAAESALAQAKEAGRDCTRFYLPQMQAAAKARMDLETALRRALRDEELTLYYQPQCDHNGRILSVEALLRWPRTGAPDMVASPGVFVPMAEDSGLIHELGEWVISAALRDLETLNQSTGAPCPQRVALNVSPVQFRQPDFAETLAKPPAGGRARSASPGTGTNRASRRPPASDCAHWVPRQTLCRSPLV